MAEKNQETEDAFMDELREAIGTSESISFHLLIRRIRLPPYIGETARGYAWNIRDIIGHNEYLMRRFLESVRLPREVEEILSDPNYDYQGDRGESMFWGVGRPRLITDAQRAEMRRRRLGGWIEEPPAKRIVVEGRSGDIHQPSSSKAFQSDKESLPSCYKGKKKGEHSRDTSGSASAKRAVAGKDDPVKKDEGEARENPQKVEPGTSIALQSHNQSLPSCSKGRRKGEHLRDTSESASVKRTVAEKDDPMEKEDCEAGEVPQKVEPGTSIALQSKGIAEKDEPKEDDNETDEVPQKVEPSTSKAFQSVNPAPSSCTKGGKKDGHSRDTSELASVKQTVVEKDESENETREVPQKPEPDTFPSDQAVPSCYKKENQRNTSESAAKGTVVESAEEEEDSEYDGQDREGGSGGNTEFFYDDKQAIPSCSRDGNTVENLNVSSESVEEESWGDDWEDVPEADSNNEESYSYSESGETDECSCDLSGSAHEGITDDDESPSVASEGPTPQISESSNDSYGDDQIVPVCEKKDGNSSTSS